MKQLQIYHLIIILLLGVNTNAQSSTKEEKSMQQTIQNMFTALTNADTTALKLYCTDVVKFYEYGQVWTMDTLIQKVMVISKAADFKRINSFEFVNTAINKKTAWVTYYLQSNITRNNKQEIINWMETVILIKEKKQWKINVLHSTRLINK